MRLGGIEKPLFRGSPDEVESNVADEGHLVGLDPVQSEPERSASRVTRMHTPRAQQDHHRR